VTIDQAVSYSRCTRRMTVKLLLRIPEIRKAVCRDSWFLRKKEKERNLYITIQ
jgi:hypothetical protein